MAIVQAIPFHRFAIVASAGLVAFLALWQGIFSLMHYRPCAFQNPAYVIPPNPSAALAEFGISLVGLVVLFLGARRLREGYEGGIVSYYIAVFSLLLGQGLLAFIFLRLSTCAS
jgi:hypothetical protein